VLLTVAKKAADFFLLVNNQKNNPLGNPKANSSASEEAALDQAEVGGAV